MTGTAVQTIPTNLPAFLQRQDVVQQAEKFNAAAMGGIKAGGFPRISLSGSKFFIMDNAAEVPRQLITVKDPSGTVDVPAMVLSVVCVGANPNISKLYYEGPYVPGDDREPDCSSDDGVRPDPHIAEPVHNACATCPKNAWGSRTTPQGKEGKACTDGKRLVVIPAGHLTYKAMALNITPSMLKDWGAYVRALSSKGIPVHGVVTRLMFDSTVDHPKLIFSFERFLSEDEFATVSKRMESDEVKNIEKPVRSVSVPAAPAALPAPPAHIVPPTPASSPASSPASFGTSAAPVSAPVQPTITAPPAPPPAPVVVDPLAGLAPEVVAAINAAGGISSPVGSMIATAARNAAQPAQADPAITQAAAAVAEAPKKGRGRPRKEETAAPEPATQPATASFGESVPPPPPPAAAAPVAPPPPPPPPAQPAPGGFATSPAATVVQPGTGIANQLDDLLKGIMG